MLVNAAVFAAIMVLTFWSVFKGQDLAKTADAVRQMSGSALSAAVFLAVFFVSGEGFMIWYLLRGIGERTTLLRCISYSFIGFFFSGITPSATGGQPMQLYFLKRDKNSLSASSVVLMTVAVCYKLVLALIGIVLFLLWNAPLKQYLRGYYGLYFLGLFLNVALTVMLLLVMFSPTCIRSAFCKLEKLLERIHVWKEKASRREKVEQFLAGYRDTVGFLCGHKRLILVTLFVTFLQRSSVFVLTYVVYVGLGLSGHTMFDVVLLQASVYIAVDMLPIPGAQGITEAMYRSVFAGIFSGQYLAASTCITRGVSFYLMMLIGLAVFCAVNWGRRPAIER